MNTIMNMMVMIMMMMIVTMMMIFEQNYVLNKVENKGTYCALVNS